MNECSHTYLFIVAQYWKQLNNLYMNEQTESVHAMQCDEVAEINESLIPSATFTNLMHYKLWKGSSIKDDIVQFPVYKISNTEIYANRK